jgi:hypothetical protein
MDWDKTALLKLREGPNPPRNLSADPRANRRAREERAGYSYIHGSFLLTSGRSG